MICLAFHLGGNPGKKARAARHSFPCSGVTLANQTKKKQKHKKGPKRKIHMNFAPIFLCEFWCFSLGKQARFTSNFCSGLPMGKVHLRIGNGDGKQGYGNRPPIDDRNPIRKFSIDHLCLQNQWDNSASTDSPQQRIQEKS